MKERPNYYAIITADVRYDNRLTPNAKLLYAEISALCNMNGKCTAPTSYFTRLYQVSRISVQKWLKSLEDLDYIKRVVKYKQGSKEILARYITIINKPSKEKLTDNNNININNTNITYSNTIEKRKEKFLEEVYNICYAEKLLSDLEAEDFCDYWTETNKTGKKMRFEMQKTFNINLRIKRWSRNNFNKKSNMSKIDYQLSEYIKGKNLL